MIPRKIYSSLGWSTITIGRSTPMENEKGYTHETPALIERVTVEIGHSKEMTEVRIQPSTRKYIK